MFAVACALAAAGTVAADTCVVVRECGAYYTRRASAWGADGTCCEDYYSYCCRPATSVSIVGVLLLLLIIMSISWFCCFAASGLCYPYEQGHSHRSNSKDGL